MHFRRRQDRALWLWLATLLLLVTLGLIVHRTDAGAIAQRIHQAP